MAQTQIDYNEWFFGAFGMQARHKVGTIPAGQGALVAGTVMVLNSANKYVKWDSASVAAVLTVAASAIAAPVVTTVDAVTASGTPDTKEAVIKTVAAPVLTAPVVTTGAVDNTSIVGMAILLEAIDATDEVTTAKLGISGGVLASALVLAGSTIQTVTNYVKAALQINGIFVTTNSNSANLAGV